MEQKSSSIDKKETELFGRWSLLTFVTVLQTENTHTEYKSIQKTEDSRKVLDLMAENKLPLVQNSQFTSFYHYIYFLIKTKKKWNEIKFGILQGTAHTRYASCQPRLLSAEDYHSTNQARVAFTDYLFLRLKRRKSHMTSNDVISKAGHRCCCM